MCCGGMNYPNPLGVRISTLKPGDEIIILKGEGYPAVAKETATIVWKISGYSALTVSGVSISCMNLSDLIVTGHRFETYQVNAEAMRLWGEVLAHRKEAQDGPEPDWTVPDPFPPQPE